MKNFKVRALCFILTAVMLCSTAFSADVTSQESAVNEEAIEAMEFLQLLNIIPADYYDYNTLMDEKVSRADFVDAVARLIGGADYKGSTYYYDVPQTHYAYNSIAMLTEMGIVNGTGNNLFSPEDAIDGAAAYKIILSLMGYNVHAENDGGYPNGYLKIARKIDLLDTDWVLSEMTRGEMFILLFEAAKKDVYEPIVFSETEGNVFVVSEGDTLLSIYQGILYHKGTVTGAEFISLSGNSLAEAETVEIDGVMYPSEISLTEALGEEVEFFTRIDKGTDIETVFWAKKTGKSEVLSIEEGNIAGFDKATYTLSYYSGSSSNSIKKVAIDRGVTLIYNGVVVEENIYEIFDGSRMSVKLVESDGKYNTAVVKAYENYVVGMIDSSAEVIYDIAEPSKSLSFSEDLYEYTVIRDKDGKELMFSDIKSGDVLSTYLSKDKTYMEVVVSDLKPSGILSLKKSVEEGTELTVNGVSYLMPEGVETEQYNIGDNVILYMDYKGMVAYLSSYATDNFAAYVFAAAISEGVFSSEVSLKMLNQNGKVEILKCAEKVVVDGTKTDDPDAIKNIFFNAAGVFQSQLVLIKVNADNEISELDSVIYNDSKESITDTLQQNMTEGNRMYRGTGAFDSDAVINTSTIIFEVPNREFAETAGDDYYRVVNMSSLANNGYYTVASYNTTNRNGYEKYVVTKYNNARTGEDMNLPLLVTGVGETVTDEGEIVKCLNGYKGNALVEVPANGEVDFSGIEEGMLVRTFLDLTNKVYKTEILFDPENKTYGSNGWNMQYGVHKGFVHDIVGDVVKTGFETGAKSDHVIQRNNAPILVYNSEYDRGKIYAGSFSDAATYYNEKEACSSVVIITEHNMARLFVIYK